MNQIIKYNKDLLTRYDLLGPRYTSYPTVPQFSESFTEEDYRNNIELSNSYLIPKPLSLYFHIPFCDSICYYCACNKIVTKNRSKSDLYLQFLIHELKLQGELFDKDRQVEQLHWGGGTPTFLSNKQIIELMEVTRSTFKLRDDDKGEYSIEIDPRKTDKNTIDILRTYGFNRISIGVQDFSLNVQRAVNRIQPESVTNTIVEAARKNYFKSINFDLIYGLPFQTVNSFEDTINKVINYSPDRISIYNYAHLPQIFGPQRKINAQDLPSTDEKLAILQMVIEKLTNAGYLYIGMDHFAKRDNELAIAQRNGSLHRNFQGYSAHQECDLVSMGITAISNIGDCFSQNVKSLDAYYKSLNTQNLAILKGYKLHKDDKIRQRIISEITCYSKLDIKQLEYDFDIKFKDYFSSILGQLIQIEEDGLITQDNEIITVTQTGRLLLRNIAMIFDKYLYRNTDNSSSTQNLKVTNRNQQYSRLI